MEKGNYKDLEGSNHKLTVEMGLCKLSGGDTTHFAFVKSLSHKTQTFQRQESHFQPYYITTVANHDYYFLPFLIIIKAC